MENLSCLYPSLLRNGNGHLNEGGNGWCKGMDEMSLMSELQSYFELIQASIRSINDRRVSDIFKPYLDHPASLPLLRAALKYLKGRSRMAPELAEQCEKELRGEIFEKTGFIMLQAQEERGERIVLSPEETLLLFGKMHPDRGNDYGQIISVGLEGTSVPDGLIMERGEGSWQVLNFIEYTINPNNGRFSLRDRWEHQLGSMKREIDRLGRGSNGPRLGEVPVSASVEMPQRVIVPQKSRIPQGVDPCYYPMTGGEFYDAVQSLFFPPQEVLGSV